MIKSKNEKMKELGIVLNKRITILSNEQVQDDFGFNTEEEKEIFKCLAKVNNISGTEIFKAGADYSKVKTRFLIRYRKDIEFTTDMKIKFNNKTYNIIYLNNYNYGNRFLELIGEVIE